MLHVLNGDATRFKLERSGIAGTLTVWADALHEGPVPADIDDDELMRLRAAHFALLSGEPEERILAMVGGWTAGLARLHEFDEAVFWLEHDLFDQLILLRHLHWLSAMPAPGTKCTLICIGSFPGVPEFSGLGPLAPEQLATLLPDRTTITPTQLAVGREGWSLFRGADPRPFLHWAQRDLPELPFMPGALRRHFEDYPSVRNGLSRSERQILSALQGGERSFPDVFVACQRMEERVFMGDTIFGAILGRLASGRNPLVTLAGGDANRDPSSVRMALTDLGAVVLEDGADHVELNGIDRWMGGVHLTPAHTWRWDAEAELLTLGEP